MTVVALVPTGFARAAECAHFSRFKPARIALSCFFDELPRRANIANDELPYYFTRMAKQHADFRGRKGDRVVSGHNGAVKFSRVGGEARGNVNCDDADIGRAAV